jgi:hypothetical protein
MKNSNASTGRKAKKPAAKSASKPAVSSQPPAGEPETAGINTEETPAETDSVESPDSAEATATEPAKKRTVDDINNQLYREAAQRILDAIEAGTSIWQKPWNPPSSHRRPFNAHSGLNYLGVNRVLFAYFSPSWTAFQADRGRDFSVIVDGISN